MSITLNDKLHIVERPEMQPGYCMATMSDRDPKGFIDTMNTPSCFDPRVYISVSWVEEAARKLGMEYPEPSTPAEKRVVELEEQLREADAQLRAIEVIESAGFTAKKKAAAKKKTTRKATK